MATEMTEERPLFIEKKITVWGRIGSPRPGVEYVFVGDGVPVVRVSEGKRGPTHGEILWGKYRIYYEVDMGERLISFNEKLLSRDSYEFNADVKISYAVDDPIIIVRRSRADADRFLKELSIDAMRRISRKYQHDEAGEAEDEIVEILKKKIIDEGFKLIKHAFVRLSLDESITTLIKQKQVNNIKFDIKRERAEKISSFIQSGNWPMLLAMFDPNDPEDEYLRQILATMSEQRSHTEATRNKLLEIAIEKDAIEGHELTALAKYLLQEKTGLSDKAIAFISEKTGPISDKNQEERKIPDEISRKKTD